jgi:hypothetical protein
VDYFDRRLPSTVEWGLWVISQVSLILHVITIGINLGVIWVRAAAAVVRSRLPVQQPESSKHPQL